MVQKIRALLIYEILGRPPEHVKESLEKFLDRFEQTGVHIENKKIHEPKLVEEKNVHDLYTTFGEIEVTVDDLKILFSVVLNTLPSTVEILSPSELSLKNFEIGGVLSELTTKLHKYDEITKTIAIERDNLLRRLIQIDPRLRKAQDNMKVSEVPLDDKKEKKLTEELSKGNKLEKAKDVKKKPKK